VSGAMLELHTGQWRQVNLSENTKVILPEKMHAGSNQAGHLHTYVVGLMILPQPLGWPCNKYGGHYWNGMGGILRRTKTPN